MNKDNSTGKNKDFYELGKKMFDRLNPPGTPEFKPYFPKRKWVGLTDAEWSDLYEAHHDKYNLPKQQGSPDGMDYERAIEAKLKELNHD